MSHIITILTIKMIMGTLVMRYYIAFAKITAVHIFRKKGNGIIIYQ